jgi:23S rRNA (adenine-N6)-dimethyltransferase
MGSWQSWSWSVAVASPYRQWGWHELDPSWARWLVAESGVMPGAWVLDIGAGTGALTAPLIDAGARVIAVEAHPGRADQLRRSFGNSIVVVRADAGDLRLPRRPYHVVANPPFVITSAVLRRLLQPGSRVVTATLVVQDQVARRWAAARAPGAGRWSRQFAVEAGRRVPRTAFWPAPRVDTRVLRIERRTGIHRTNARSI